MADVNFSAIHGPYRRKVTIACGSCRKRRVKCSGTQPCTLCLESGRQCEFHNNNRSRRGPRPRQPAEQTPRIIHQLAPRHPSAAQRVVLDVEVQVSPVKSPQALPKIVELDQIVVNTEEQEGGHNEDGDDGNDDDDDDDDDNDDVNEFSDQSLWKPYLEKLLYGKDSILHVLPALEISVVYHLIEIFCARSNAHLKSLLPPDQIRQCLARGIMTRGLILAICASSIRFTIHKAVRGPKTRRLAASISREARNSIRVSSDSWKQVNNVKATCILVDYEASRAHGRQAWVDIATGLSLIELARAACDLDGEQIEALNVAAEYLAIAKTSHCLGHAVLRSSCERLSKKPSLESSRPSCPEDCSHLVELLQLLVCVHQLCSTPLGEQNPLPWAPQSRFRELQDELEDYLLRHPNTFRFGGGPPLYHSPKSNFDGSIMASLVWHCGVIILNRTFLPIPERPPPTGEVAVVRCIEFPQAPPLFLKERVYRCVSSSDAICEITRDVIKGGGFYSHAVWVGFACAQSAFVSINRLHRSSKPYDDRIVENLKLAFIVLGALKTFYKPAEDWMSVLFKVHETNTGLRHPLDSVEAAFGSYFSRFVDIEEPTFMPLGPKDTETTDEDEEDEEADNRDHGSGAVQSPQNPPEKEGTEQIRPETTSNGPEWLHAYAGHLSGDIDAGEDLESPAGESDNISAVQGGLVKEGVETQQHPAFSAEEQHSQRTALMTTDTDAMEPQSPMHVAGAILTSMSGQMSNPATYLQGIYPRQPRPDELGDSIPVDIGDTFSSLFGLGQPPAFADDPLFNSEMSMFLGLGSSVGGPDLWPDIFPQDVFK